MKTLLKYMRPMTFEAEGTGTGTGDDAAAQAAAAEKAAADKAAADKKAADEKAAADAEAARGNETEAQKLLREVMEKKAKLKEADAAKAELEAQLKRFDGIDPDDVRALLEEKRQNELKSEEAKGNFENVKKMMAEEHAKSVKDKETRIAELEALLGVKDGTINELTIGRSFSDSTYIAENLVLTRSKARALYGSHFEMTENGVVAYDKPAGQSNRTMLVDASGNPMAFEDAMKRIIEADPDKDQLIRVKVAPGAGSSTQKVPVVEKKEDKGLFGVSRIAAAFANGQK
jgi:hypothetical protein